MRWFVALAGVLMIAGCAAEPSPTATSDPEPSAEAPSLGVLDSLDTACVDATGDGSLGGDLTTTQLIESQGLLFVTFNLAGNVQSTDFDSTTVQVLSYGLDGNGGYIIGTQFTDGSELATYVFDNTEARQENLDNGTVFADGMVAMRVPLDMVASLGAGFEWRVTLTVDGVDVDECDWVTVEV